MANKVILKGWVGSKDPELVTVPGDRVVAKFSFCTKKTWQGKETLQWHNILAWGKTAEMIGKYVRAGQELYLEGELGYRKYKKEGQDHLATEVTIHHLEFCGPKTERQAPAADEELPF